MHNTRSLFFRLHAALTALVFCMSFCVFFSGYAEARQVFGRTHTSIHGGGPGNHGPRRDRNVNINKNVNVRGDGHHHDDHHHDNHHHDDHYPPPPRHYDDHYHHHHDDIGTALAIGAITGLVVGSIVSAASMPPSCTSEMINGIAYKRCGSTWYQPRYSGDQVTYIVVNPPR